jgi:hypothetical protein
MYACMHVRMYVCTHVRMYVCTHACICMHASYTLTFCMFVGPVLPPFRPSCLLLCDTIYAKGSGNRDALRCRGTLGCRGHDCKYACVHAYMHTFVCMHVRMYACVYVCMCACARACMRTCVHACVYVWTHAHVCLCMHACACCMNDVI